MGMTATLPPPVDLGIPFAAWRPGQIDAILHAIDSGSRFVSLVLPTGFGKSAVYRAIPKLTGWQTTVLTSTKALQRQLSGDFGDDPEFHLVQGQREYPCTAVLPGQPLAQFYDQPPADLRVDEGPCHAGADCGLKASGCPYYDAVRTATIAPFLVTNYAWWHRTLQTQVRVTPDLLVLDEAHAAPDALAAAIGARIVIPETRRYLSAYAGSLAAKGADPIEWKQWASQAAGELRKRVDSANGWVRSPADGRTLRRLSNLLTEVRKLALMDPDTIVITPEDAGEVMRFDPIWAAPFAEQWLFRGIGRILLTSATMTRHTTELLGILPRDLDYYDSGDGFAADRRPVWVCPAKTRVFDEPVRVDHRMNREQEMAWRQHIDAIVGARADRKGIIHTVSYRRRDQILAESAHRSRMLTHTKADTARQIERFRQSPAGTVLVSPAVTTGYDFPYDDCEYQIICKIPFPDSRDPVTKMRTVVDPKYPAYLALQELVQAVGRGMRAPDDRCECFIVDAHAFWFFRKNRALAPRWFWRAVRTTDALPPPPPRVDRGHS